MVGKPAVTRYVGAHMLPLFWVRNRRQQRLDPKTGKLRVADRSCSYMRLGAALTEQDAEILEQADSGHGHGHDGT